MSSRPIEILMEEHQVIEKALAAMRRYAQALASGEPIDREQLAGLVPFMREFADACHHGKEEHRLFPALVAKGLPASNGPVQVMCAEHETGRRLVGDLETAIRGYEDGQEGAAAELAEVLLTIAEFYARHIWKENNVLFPMADRILDADDVATLMAAFDEVEGPHGAQVHERFAAYAGSLA